MKETETLTRPAIYVADLAAYNAGRLHGCWIDAAHPVEALYAAIQTMLETSPAPGAEEYVILDSEGFYPYKVDPHDSLWDIATLAKGIVKYGPAYAHWWTAYETPSVEFEEAYDGYWDSLQAYAEMLLDRAHCRIPGGVAAYIDFEKLTQDILLSGQVTVSPGKDGGVYIFRNW